MDITRRTSTSLPRLVTNEVEWLLTSPVPQGRVRASDVKTISDRQRLRLFLVLIALAGKFQSLSSYVQSTFSVSPYDPVTLRARNVLRGPALKEVKQALEYPDSHPHGSTAAIFCEQVSIHLPEFTEDRFAAIQHQVRRFLAGHRAKSLQPIKESAEQPEQEADERTPEQDAYEPEEIVSISETPPGIEMIEDPELRAIFARRAKIAAWSKNGNIDSSEPSVPPKPRKSSLVMRTGIPESVPHAPSPSTEPAARAKVHSRVQVPKTTPCPELGLEHYWLLEPPAGPTCQAVCTTCGMETKFQNSQGGSSWNQENPQEKRRR